MEALQGSRWKILLATAAIVCGLTWLGAWLAGWIMDPGTLPTHYLLLGIGFLLVSLLVLLWLGAVAREQRVARSYFELLSRLDPRDLAGDLDQADLPVLPESNPWYALARRLHEALAENGSRTQQAEHARAAAEARVQRLRSERDQIQAILDTLSDPVIAIDAFDEIVLANPSAAELFDLEEDPAERALKTLQDCDKLVQLLTDTRRRKTPTLRVGEVEIRDASGQGHWYSVSTRSIPTSVTPPVDDTRVHGAVAVLRDISGHKAVQKRNAEFVSAVSHEMKTPLAGIKAYVELLADGDAEDEQTREEFLNVINTQTDRLQRLIDNLLNLARIEAGVVNVSKQARSLNELLEEAVHVMQPAAMEKQIELRTDLSPMYLGVLADRDMILQAAFNLLSNAIKYTPVGGTVTLRSRMQDNDVLFEVEDTGVGLSEEDAQKVFEKFYRVQKDRAMAQGTGLGLPLAKHIVEDVHGGCLTVHSELGRGSSFRITLPVAGKMS